MFCFGARPILLEPFLLNWLDSAIFALMMSSATWHKTALFLILTTLFAVSYAQSPLYTSNQYQYFVHGLAHCGMGTLSEDWLASTADPTPVFSLIVEWACRLNVLPVLYVVYAFLMGIYLFSLIGIVETVVPLKKSPLVFAVFLTLTFVQHSPALRYLLTNLAGPNWAYLFDGGVAGQRLLGPVFQPSTFGVFLLLSLWFFLQGKVFGAVLSAVFAATVHPTYLLSAGVLILAYLLELVFWKKQWKQAMLMGALALATVSPILTYTWLQFSGSDPLLAARARDILVNIRIPHHARIQDWFDATTLVKLAVVVTALVVMRRHRLFLLLVFPLSISLVLTLLQVVSGNQALALIFPWRLSSWLVPVTAAVLIAELARLLVGWTPAHCVARLRFAVMTGIALLVLAGIFRTGLDVVERSETPSRPLAAYVAGHRQPGQVYLIPPKLYDFRLNAAVPVYGDFFSIPYRDAEVIEWYSRFLNAQHFYESGNCDLLDELAGQGVTHVVLSNDFAVSCSALSLLYHDSVYRLFALKQAGANAQP